MIRSKIMGVFYHRLKQIKVINLILFFLYLALFFSVFISDAFSQTFSATIGSTIDLTGANGSCATPGAGAPNVSSIAVSGVGTLSSTNALIKISVTLDNSCTGSTANLNLVSFRVMSPTGVCAGVYSGGLSTSASGTNVINLVTPQSCINYPNSANSTGSSTTASGNNGWFGAQFSGVPTDLTATYNGLAADGTWKIIFSESTTSEPCLVAASLTFGDPNSMAVQDQTANGNTCSSAIVYCGLPFCAQTNGKTGELNSPGSNTGQGDVSVSTFNNGTCAWNANNNNDVWISFKAVSTSVCINISGLDQQLQSVVVTNPSGDGSTCVANGEQWNVVSCPRDMIYTTTAGTTKNQQHCFSTTVGNTYYLVVDGEGGAESPFYVNLSSGITSCTNLSVNLEKFEAKNFCFSTVISWATSSERNNNYFILEYSEDGQHYSEVGIIPGSGTSSSDREYFFNHLPNLNLPFLYYRLTQVDYNGSKTVYSPTTVRNDCRKQNLVLNNGFLELHGFEQIESVEIFDFLGRKVHSDQQSRIDLSNLSSAFYEVKIKSNHETYNQKFYKP